ncbi:MAG: tRNA guanosine(34) transglycosylase Tgt [Acidobacteriota bacterium]
MRSGYRFQITATDPCGARRATLHTPRGAVETPAFMPVGTSAAVKAVSPSEVRTTGAGMILANTYHLIVRPGTATIRKLGGLHIFGGWDGPILTDSGGYQVFSLASRRCIDDSGVVFRSHLDGSRIELTPASSVAAQEDLGSDVIMALDECTGQPGDRDAAARAMIRSAAWGERCLAARRGPAALFGIVQGGLFEDLRRESVERTLATGFDGVAIGGVSVGESREEVARIVASTAAWLPPAGPRYLMGVGSPGDLLEMIGYGMDLFDCVMPTRNARNGTLFVAGGRVQIRNSHHREDAAPVETGCPCDACTHHSRAYLRHLFMAGEIYGLRLNTLHNLTHYQRLMAASRAAISAGRLADFRAAYVRGDPACLDALIPPVASGTIRGDASEDL